MTSTSRRAARVAGAVAVLAAVCVVLGFVAFIASAVRPSHPGHGRADAIVVLTGGSARLAEAGRLLKAQRGRRLLVSGVNQRVTREDLERLTGLEPGAFQCCVDVDYLAQDTIGNAGETLAWVRRYGYRSLLVVTASYHMPRSLAELAHVMPDITLFPHAVVPKELAAAHWWQDRASLRLLAGEYVKYLSSAARRAVARATTATGLAHADASPQGRALAGRP